MRELISLLYWFFKDRRHFLLRIIALEANKYLAFAKKYNLHNVEDIEDLIYHIHAYLSVERSVRETLFNKVDILNLVEYRKEVEMQKAVERDFIFEELKGLPIGFVI